MRDGFESIRNQKRCVGGEGKEGGRVNRLNEEKRGKIKGEAVKEDKLVQ